MLLIAHGRQVLRQMLETMGCFATSYPQHLPAPPVGARAGIEHIRSCVQKVPHRGARYRWLMSRPEWMSLIIDQPQPSLVFNYWGVSERIDLFSECQYSEMLTMSAGQPWDKLMGADVPFLLVNCAALLNSQSVRIDCDYSRRHFSKAQISLLLNQYESLLRASTEELLSACRLDRVGSRVG